MPENPFIFGAGESNDENKLSPGRKRLKPEETEKSGWKQTVKHPGQSIDIGAKVTRFLGSTDWDWQLGPNGHHYIQGVLHGKRLTISWWPQTCKVLIQGKPDDEIYFRKLWDEMEQK